MSATKVTGRITTTRAVTQTNAPKIPSGRDGASVAMEMTYCQLMHPRAVAGGVIGFEMMEGEKRTRQRRAGWRKIG